MRRTERGAGLVEGAVGLMMVVGGGILVTFLILDCGTAVYFKNKLLLITGQAAQFAAAHGSDPGVRDETMTFVQNLMPTVGLTPRDLNVTVNSTAMNGVQGVQVTVSNQFPLFGKGMLPNRIQLDDTEFANSSISIGQ
jgi:hypothetical protein